MRTVTSLDLDRIAVLSMDFQVGILAANAPNAETTLARAARVLVAARAASVPIIHVAHRGAAVVEKGEDAKIHPTVAPREGEPVLIKTRAGPFSTTGLDVLLRELRRDTLVLMGVMTSGVVLSTVRWGADLGYRLVIVRDACDDRDPEVHRVLIEKVFRSQTPVSAEEVAGMLSGPSTPS